MSAPVDVLAVMERSAKQHWEHGDHADAEDAEAARAAVAELIEADKEYDDALANLTAINREIAERGWVALEADALRTSGERFSRSAIRRDRALACIGGAA